MATFPKPYFFCKYLAATATLFITVNNNTVKHLIVNKINLDNPRSKELIDKLEWIKIEVDFVPFWTLIIESKRIKSVRGNVKIVKEII